ncbi:hypothetical protein AB0J63_37925 [Streptosporangium canum]|uniref:hypothetical protein n=1 Tax=Streptosporangium canum TaxID=324952 RepID=UPI0034310CE8
MQLIPIPSTFTAAPADARLAPDYYVQPDGLGAYITRLLRSCPTVFDIKATMTADLDHLTAVGLHTEPGGVVEDGALLQGEVIVQAGARIEAGAQVVGPVLICAGAIVAAGPSPSPPTTAPPRSSSPWPCRGWRMMSSRRPGSGYTRSRCDP